MGLAAYYEAIKDDLEESALKGIIIKDDDRYQHSENYLKNCGHIFCKTNEPPENLDFIVFPFKEAIDNSIYDDRFFKALRSNIVIFSGVRNAYIANKCKENKLEYYVLTEDCSVAIKNAVPTSEGVIAYLITNRINTVANSRVLVIGYGICGRDLSKRMRALGANVYAVVRNREKESLAYVDSVTPLYLDEFSENINFDIVINTVPKCILTNEMLDKLQGAIMIDIASKPHGFDIEYAKKLNKKSELLLGIPGKYAKRTAGEILGEHINNILCRRK